MKPIKNSPVPSLQDLFPVGLRFFHPDYQRKLEVIGHLIDQSKNCDRNLCPECEDGVVVCVRGIDEKPTPASGQMCYSLFPVAKRLKSEIL